MSNRSFSFSNLVLGVAILGVVFMVGAGSVDPPAGPVEPTMRTLDEVYNLIATPQSCPPCTWEYEFLTINKAGGGVEAVQGAGILHGFYIKGFISLSFNGGVLVSDGPSAEGNVFGSFVNAAVDSGQFRNIFFELNLPFENGLYFDATENSVHVTVLYRSTTP